MLKLKDILTEINKNSLEYLSSITTDINEPFNPPQYLYHLSSHQNIDSILQSGLHPGTPEPSMHAGQVKGEQFSGVWLTPIDNVDEIVDAHYLPDEFYVTRLTFKELKEMQNLDNEYWDRLQQLEVG